MFLVVVATLLHTFSVLLATRSCVVSLHSANANWLVVGFPYNGKIVMQRIATGN